MACPSQQTDDELLDAGRHGDHHAVELLLRRHAASTRSVLSLHPKYASAIDIDDIMQMTWLEAFLDFPRFRGTAAGLTAWLRSIARNNLRDAISLLTAEKRPPPDRCCGHDEVLERLCRSNAAAADSDERAETRRVLEAEVEHLPPEYAEVIGLVHFHDLSIRHVADRMGRTPDATYVLWRRALAALARRLRPMVPPESASH